MVIHRIHRPSQVEQFVSSQLAETDDVQEIEVDPAVAAVHSFLDADYNSGANGRSRSLCRFKIGASRG